MCTKLTGAVTRFIATSAAILAVALAATGARSTAAAAEVEPSQRVLHVAGTMLQLKDVEEAFWMCDHVATTRGVDATPAGFCSEVYDALKTHRFDGDFDELLEWWRLNKPAEHARLAAGG